MVLLQQNRDEMELFSSLLIVVCAIFYLHTMRKALFVGSFDPFTLGHLDIVQRASKLFDEVTVLLALNQAKQGLFSTAERLEIIRLSTQTLGNVRVDSTDGLTVEYMRTHHIPCLLRGVRNSKDLEWEQSIAFANSKLNPEVETILLMGAPEHLFLSSSIVREMLSFGGDVGDLVAPAALSLVRSKCLR